MSLNFPSNPTVGARYALGDKVWEWNGTGWKGAATGVYANALRLDATAPATGTQGDFWLDTTTGVLYTYIDQNDGQWVEFNGSAYPVDYLPTSGGTLTGNVNNTATGYFAIPSGTTGQRPITPINGMLRYNSTIGAVEAYVNGAWQLTANSTLDCGLTTTSATSTFDYGALV